MFFYFFIIERGNSGKERRPRVVIVTHLAERSLPISEFRVRIQSLAKFYNEHDYC